MLYKGLERRSTRFWLASLPACLIRTPFRRFLSSFFAVYPAFLPQDAQNDKGEKGDIERGGWKVQWNVEN